MKRVNSTNQSKGPIYILYLLTLIEIRLFHVFVWEGFGTVTVVKQKCGMRDSREKGAGMWDQDSPFKNLIAYGKKQATNKFTYNRIPIFPAEF